MNRTNLTRFLLLSWMLLLAAPLWADTPEWIWHDNKGARTAPNEVRYFYKNFNIKGEFLKATLTCAGDDELELYLNGNKIAEVWGWAQPPTVDVTKFIHHGDNVLTIRGKNDSGPAAVIAMLEITVSKRRTDVISTDTSWVSTASEPSGWTKPDFSASGWTKVVSLGKIGIKPYGEIFKAHQATPVEGMTVAPGFKVELIHSAQSWEGSWICMTKDAKGRLIISPQQGVSNLLRVTLDRNGDVDKIEKIDQPVGTAMGLLYAFNSLYVNGSGPEGVGLYRLMDDAKTDKFGAPTLLKKMENATGEHGSHAVVLGPDKHIYIVSGNFTHVPEVSAESAHKNFAEDQLLPRAEDGNGFGTGVKPPGGFLLRTDENGKNWELVCAGMRNTYDFDFNTDGEMLGFDSDMEWDWGMPWYRPTRICHLVSGADFGFREGSGKWPKYYPDSLPSVVDVGIGSPTGLKFGTASDFPEKYKKALFAFDWSYGRIFAVHLTPKGATYDGTVETVLHGKPLNLTDLEFGKDGAMYFITGGRGTQSGLYRLTYVGKDAKDEPKISRKELKVAAKAREHRHELEAFHGKQDPRAVKFAWPYLDSNDRWLRYAARIAIESQPVLEWQDRALSETRTNAALTALLALARCGGKETQGPLLRALTKFPLEGASEEHKLEKLRVIELSFIRQGHPDAALTKMAIEKLDRYYPSKDEWLNRELAELLIYLQAPDAVAKTLSLLDTATTQEEQVHYMLHLRTLTNGWTLPERKHYFSWFDRDRKAELGEPTYKDGSGYYPWSKRAGEKPQHSAQLMRWFSDAEREYGDGSSFPKYISAMRKTAMESLSDREHTELASFLRENTPDVAPKTNAVVRKFVQEWKMADLDSSLDAAAKGRSFARGKEVFTAAQCIQCHRFGNEGGSVGPDLTAISSRFARRDILESIIDPSKVVSEQYQNMLIIKNDGDDVLGRLVEDGDKKIVVMTNPLTQTKVEVLKSDIKTRQPSKVSPMPEGLVNTFSKEEILDLIAFLESGGKETAPAFKNK